MWVKDWSVVSIVATLSLLLTLGCTDTGGDPSPTAGGPEDSATLPPAPSASPTPPPSPTQEPEPSEPVDHDGDGFSAQDGDCDDSNEDIHPDAEEVCDGEDNDCDERFDEGGVCTGEEVDEDGDGIPEGEDCDDNDADVHPGASEVCDDVDNNCDGVNNEVCDEDGDGYSPPRDCDDEDPDTHPGPGMEVCDGKDNDCDGEIDDTDCSDPSEPPEGSEGTDTPPQGSPTTPEVVTDTPRPPDQDGDGSPDDVDCDDTNPDVHPGAAELCDGQDNDCTNAADDATIWYRDNDKDGWGGSTLYTRPGSCAVAGISPQTGDCMDSDASVHPGAEEICGDHLDNNCDGQIDQGVPETCDGADNNCDGRVDEGLECGTSADAGDTDGDGYSPASGDCDDEDPQTHPGAEEECNSLDDDCDGQVDDGLGEGCTNGWVRPTDVDGDGYALENGDCDDRDASTHPGAEEVCDGRDNNCDGATDEGLEGCDTTTDEDGDGYSPADGDCDDHDPDSNPAGEEQCDLQDNNCDGLADEGLEACNYDDTDEPDRDEDGYTVTAGDCDDRDSNVHPGATEWCDGADNDCDLEVDEGAAECGTDPDADADGDGYSINDGDCDDSDDTVGPEQVERCDLQDNNCDGEVDEDLGGNCAYNDGQQSDFDGDGYTVAEGDCHDFAAGVYPGAEEVCDGLDNNCDGAADEGLEGCPSSSVDNDGDGLSEDDGDCNDHDAGSHPGAEESCDLIDNNCDGVADNTEEECDYDFSDDVDLDGDGTTLEEGDCNDHDAASHPGAAELCDGADNNCDGVADEGLEGCAYDPDVDHDGDGVTVAGGDCDDTDPDVHPGAQEVCDAADNDCDGPADEGMSGACGYPHDADQDGDGYTLGEGDCDDLDASTWPGAPEQCDAVDNDCDGVPNDGLSDCDGDVDHDGDGVTLDEGDCDDADPSSFPGAAELCDSRDNNCDGAPNDGLPDCQPENDPADVDGDGYTLGEGDCNDFDASSNPDGVEICDGRDNNCDGTADEGLSGCDTDGDADGDGTTTGDGDCNDHNADTEPGATELCDGQDNNCDGQADEGLAWCGYPPDSDDDGDGTTALEGDCDDQDSHSYPGAPETCDAQDNNCDGLADEGLDDCDIDPTVDHDGDGVTIEDGDCDDTDPGAFPGAPERCDGDDDDCDGYSDEDAVGECEDPGEDVDLDGDGFTVGEGDCDDHDAAQAPGEDESCDGIDNNCDGEADEGLSGCDTSGDGDGDGVSPGEGDCDDTDPGVGPAQEEVCDGQDNNCDGLADEGLGDSCSYPEDGDEDNDGSTVLEGDCDDNDAGTYPGAPERCDQQDNNCNGQIDEAVVGGCDSDGDGFESGVDCDDQDAGTYPGAPERCDDVDNDCDGAITDVANPSDCDYDGDGQLFSEGDCNPYNPTIYTGAPELCDKLDNNCNSEVDEGLEESCDFDGDGWTEDEGDCNDRDPSVNPGAEEICDLKDNDCDGDMDEGQPPECDLTDTDKDGDGYSIVAGDCNDTDATIYPGAPEVCNARDDDCDGLTDEGLAPYEGAPDSLCLLTADVDGDGVPSAANPPDCNDFDPSMYPGATELCDEKDNNCDGVVDNTTTACTYCEDLDGDGWCITEGDCNDTDATVYPGAPELCDRQNNDCADVCNPADPGCLLQEYYDNDQDGFVECTGDCDDTTAAANPAEEEQWYDTLDSDCDGALDPDACLYPPPATSVAQTCAADLELIVLKLCKESETSCSRFYQVPAVFEVLNHGTSASPAGLKLAIYGVDASGRYKFLKTQTLPSIPAGRSGGGFYATVDTFENVYAYTEIVLSVDDDGTGKGTYAECNEDNNRGGVYVADLDCPLPDPCLLPPPPRPVPSNPNCIYQQPIGTTWEPVVEWQWSGGGSYGSYDGMRALPVVGNLTDDNGDGRIDQKDVPDVVGVFWGPSGASGDGVIRALSGADGRELWATPGVFGSAGAALGDADGDGVPEVYSTTPDGDLISFTNTGARRWVCDVNYSGGWEGQAHPAIADREGDGVAEILLADTICNPQGKRVQVTRLSHENVVPFFADVDQDGYMEVVSGAGISNYDGTTRCSTGVRGFAAIANFDSDSRPEIVAMHQPSETLYLFDDNCAKRWTYSVPAGSGGAPTVADFDGDGAPEIGVASLDYYTVLEGNGTVKWVRKIYDHSSGWTGSSVYDFNGDGKAEVVQADERDLWIFDGTTGAVLAQVSGHASGTRWEYPLIVDVDNDGHVEIVLASDGDGYGGGWTGITVIGDRNNNWVTGRPVWNQHAYHITNVDDDLGIPRRPVANWISGNNTFRQGGFGTKGALAAPDLVPAYIKTCQGLCDGSSSEQAELLFQIQNTGTNKVEAGLPWTLYGETSSGSRSALDSGLAPNPIAAGTSSETLSAFVRSSTAASYSRLILEVDSGPGNGTQNECVEDNNEVVVSSPLCQ